MKIKSWDDVDAALAEISACQVLMADHRSAIDRRKAVIEELAPRIEAFVREHEDELQERSKALPHGRVWLRSATRLIARSWAKVLETMKARRATAYIRTKEEVDKDSLSALTDEGLAALGIRRKTEDVFGYEVA